MGQQTIKTKCTWTEKCGCVYALIQLSNGMVASGIDKLIKLWDFKNEVYTITSQLEGHTDCVSSLLETRRQNYLLSGSQDNTIRLWNLFNNQCLTQINIHLWTISSIIELDQNRLVTSSWDHSIKVWNLNTFKHISLEEHTEAVTSMVQLNRGRIASGSDDNTIKIWYLKKTRIHLNSDEVQIKSMGTMPGHQKVISCMLPFKENYLISGSYDGSIKIWDLALYKCIASFAISSGHLYSLIMLDTGYLISGADTNEIYIISIENSSYLKLLTSIEEHTDGVTSLLQFKGRKNANKILSGSYDCCLKIWDM